MEGTFRVGDVLVVEPLPLRMVRRGDVIVFRPVKRDSLSGVTVHRVVRQTADGFVTQGDACLHPDAYRVQDAHFIGRVVWIQRGGRLYPVWGGWRGGVWLGLLSLWRRCLQISRLPYVQLRSSAVVRYFWRPSITKVEVVTDQGVIIKYLSGGKTVAVWRPHDQFYWCKKPYDLVLEPLCS